MSFRYRKQMEEMQRAFNKTIIKLQNTSRIAEEQVSQIGGCPHPTAVTNRMRLFSSPFQDQKQTESIQVLQSQLENVTKLLLNLTATNSQLQKEVV